MEKFDIKEGELFNQDFFKEKISFNYQSSFHKNKINIQSLRFSSFDSDLSIKGEVYRGKQPSVDLSFSSKLINLDKLLQEPTVTNALMKKNWISLIPEAEAAKSGMAIVDIFSKSDYLKNMKAVFRFSLKKIIYDTLSLEKLQASSHFKFPYFYLDQASFSGLRGSWKLNSRLDLSNKNLAYRSSGLGNKFKCG